MPKTWPPMLENSLLVKTQKCTGFQKESGVIGILLLKMEILWRVDLEVNAEKTIQDEIIT
jgi:hypothetical protein